MFTGIVENQGIVKRIERHAGNKTLWFTSTLSSSLKIDQSVSHNGVCFTVEEIGEDSHRVTAISETISKSTVGNWSIGDVINLERCMTLDGRLDGHIVQGHVDTQAICLHMEEKSGSWEYRIQFPEEFALLVIEKGSICINGISLTAYGVTRTELTVGIIPYTFNHTNIRHLKVGDAVNVEFDVIGKYVQRWQQVQGSPRS